MKKLYFFAVVFGLMSLNLNAQLSILVVDDDAYSTYTIDSVTNSLDRLDYSYSVVTTSELSASPTAETMSGFDLVYWHTGNDGSGRYLWNGDETDNQHIKDYIDQGGMFWLEGDDFLYDRYTAPTVFLTGDFVYDYLGISEYHAQSKADDDVNGVPEMNVVEGNPIFSGLATDTLKCFYSTFYYIDALVKTDAAQYIYQMGPADYVFRDYYTSIYHEKGDGKVLSFAFRFDQLNNIAMADSVMSQGLEYFAQFATSKTMVESVTISAAGDATTITDNNGELQFSAEVLPVDATLPTIEWSIEAGDVQAEITLLGLLKASGTMNGNGVVTVKASAVDGSGIEASYDVTISNQGGEFITLLVNDNRRYANRYKELDTAIVGTGYLHNIHNIPAEGEAPDSAKLSGYDLVVWYTGTDGVGLELWDISDTAGADLDQTLKFNSALMSYIAEGGKVWIQGIDFMYDVYGSAPDMFEAGDFVYDMMGIKTYVAQTKADGATYPQLDVVSGNPIVNFTPFKDMYGGLNYCDVFELTDDAIPVYAMPEKDDTGADYLYYGYHGALLMEHGDARVFTMASETALMDSPGNMEAFYDDVMDYFESLMVSAEEVKAGMAGQVMELFPNPAGDQLNIIWNMNSSSCVSMEVYSITGKMVYSKALGERSEGENRFSFSTSAAGLTSGMYFMKLKHNSEQISKFVVK